MYAYIYTVLQVMLYSFYFALEELNNLKTNMQYRNDWNNNLCDLPIYTLQDQSMESTQIQVFIHLQVHPQTPMETIINGHSWESEITV